MANSFPLFFPLTTSDEMRQWDIEAEAKFGIPPLVLMENAGREAFDTLKEFYPLRKDTSVLIFAGGGNNGGDGIVLARYLYDFGCKVLLLHTTPVDKLREPVQTHAQMALKSGVSFLHIDVFSFSSLPIEWQNPSIIVDALVGIGLRGSLRERECALLHEINQKSGVSFVCSLDIPSGLCADSGKLLPESIRANLTVTFAAGKPGLYMPQSSRYTGRLVMKEIGMPAAMKKHIPPSWQLIAPQSGKYFMPDPQQHKGKAGRVLIIGGSSGMSGAPVLAALGALRTGAGLVHVVSPSGVEWQVKNAFPEIISHAVGGDDSWDSVDPAELVTLLQEIVPHSIIVGPGMGRSSGAWSVVSAILALGGRAPVVLDADALFFVRMAQQHDMAQRTGLQCKNVAQLLKKEDIVTPHPGEMASILFSVVAGDLKTCSPSGYFSRQEGIQRVQEDRSAAVKLFTAKSPACLVLKGAGTLVGQQHMPTALSHVAVASLGVGGSGDVLSGVIGALHAMGFSPYDAACLGVFLHGRAGELLQARSPRGHLARDIADAIPLAWAELVQDLR